MSKSEVPFSSNKPVLQIVHEMLGVEGDISHEDIFKKIEFYDKTKNVEVEGLTIENRFTTYCNALKPTGVKAVDDAAREEGYVRFMIQLEAQLAVADHAESPLYREGISAEDQKKQVLEKWSQISELLGDTGVNASFGGIIGKRRHAKDQEFEVFGAFAGGLGNKLSVQAFTAIITSLEKGGLTKEQQDSLHEKLIWADNVVINAANHYEFKHYAAATAQEVRQVRIQTVARESLEELSELIIAEYKSKNPTATQDQFVQGFIGKMTDIFGQDREISIDASKIFSQIANLIHDKSYSQAIYKNNLEPLLARLLKGTQEGKNLIANFDAALGKETVVTDASFPMRSLENTQAKNKERKLAEVLLGAKGTFAILIPQSVCYVVDETKLPQQSILQRLKVAALQSSDALGLNTKRRDGSQGAGAGAQGNRAKLKTDNLLFEAKGFADADFAELIEIFTHKANERDSFCYIHENLAAIIACIGKMQNVEEVQAARILLASLNPSSIKTGRDALVKEELDVHLDYWRDYSIINSQDLSVENFKSKTGAIATRRDESIQQIKERQENFDKAHLKSENFTKNLQVALAFKARTPEDKENPQTVQNVFENFFDTQLRQRMSEIGRAGQRDAATSPSRRVMPVPKAVFGPKSADSLTGSCANVLQ